ncbi:hypothetical protein M758_7G148800 [Ceratodon purpureus]|nr:hypothetical protein M758_7G148800 [Ceratodon purpureus]
MSTGAGTCCLDCRLETGGCGYKEPTTCTDPKKMACPSAAPKDTNQDDLKLWPRDDRRRILHAVYRVGDIEKTMKWMQDCLGMQILRKRDVPEEKYMNVFMGYGAEDNHFAAELTYSKCLSNPLASSRMKIYSVFRTHGLFDDALLESRI